MSYSKTRSLLFLSVFVALGFSFSTNTFAVGPTFNFGGKIKRLNTTAETQITCGAQYGPMVITPQGGSKFLPLPFMIRTTGQALRPGQQILGRYSIDYYSCYNVSTTIPVPVPSLSIKTPGFGVSK